MSKKRFGNLLKRKFSVRIIKKDGDEFIKNQLREISRFGGNLIVMQMGS